MIGFRFIQMGKVRNVQIFPSRGSSEPLVQICNTDSHEPHSDRVPSGITRFDFRTGRLGGFPDSAKVLMTGGNVLEDWLFRRPTPWNDQSSGLQSPRLPGGFSQPGSYRNCTSNRANVKMLIQYCTVPSAWLTLFFFWPRSSYESEAHFNQPWTPPNYVSLVLRSLMLRYLSHLFVGLLTRLSALYPVSLKTASALQLGPTIPRIIRFSMTLYITHMRTPNVSNLP